MASDSDSDSDDVVAAALSEELSSVLDAVPVYSNCLLKSWVPSSSLVTLKLYVPDARSVSVTSFDSVTPAVRCWSSSQPSAPKVMKLHDCAIARQAASEKNKKKIKRLTGKSSEILKRVLVRSLLESDFAALLAAADSQLERLALLRVDLAVGKVRLGEGARDEEAGGGDGGESVLHFW